jgi:hypothetical protein
MFQVKSLCEKAKEILMEESNVQVCHAGSSPLTTGLTIFPYRCVRISKLLVAKAV